MAYSYIKQAGRVAILKGGEFDHQQFRGHYAFRNPEAYIAELIRRDDEAAADAASVRIARLADVTAYLTARASRVTAQLNLF